MRSHGGCIRLPSQLPSQDTIRPLAMIDGGLMFKIRQVGEYTSAILQPSCYCGTCGGARNSPSLSPTQSHSECRPVTIFYGVTIAYSLASTSPAALWIIAVAD